MHTRRTFLRGAVAAGATLLAAPLGCAGVPLVDPRGRDGVVLGLVRGGVAAGVQAALERVGTDWLSPGDSVLVKVACNSGNRHPAVTSPDAVRAVCEALRERGAGRVLVGDQSGVMSVRLTREGRRSSTRDLMERNGLLAAIAEGGGEARLFDDDGAALGYDEAWVEARLPAGARAWGDHAPRIARAITEVDHVVYLPRLASHCLTGYTHGHKIAVGFMRDDTRHRMHFEAGTLYEKYTELNYCEELSSRLRLTLTAVDRVLVDGGPDDGAVALCGDEAGQGALVVASEHLANHDAISVQVLAWAAAHLPRGAGSPAVPFGPLAPVGNAALLALAPIATGLPWTSEGGLPSTYAPHDYAAGLASDRALARAYELLGGAPRAIEVGLVGEEPPEALVARLARSRAALA